MEATGLKTAERAARYDDVEVFRLDTQFLQPGDVILTRNRRSRHALARMKATAVARATKSAFNHAMIVTEASIAIEAMPTLGVANLNLANAFFHDPDHVRVVRYPDPAIARAAAARAGMFLAKGYSLKTFAAALVTSGDVEAPTDATFCSALVAEAFRRAGAPEFQSLHPSRTSPGDLERIGCFEPVTAGAVLKAPAPANIEKMSALDGDRIMSPMARQGDILAGIHGEVAADIAGIIATYAPDAPRPTAFFETLEFVRDNMESLAESGQGVPEAFGRDLRAVDSKLALALRRGELEGLVAEVAAQDSASVTYVIAQSFEPDPDLDRADVERVIGETREQLDMRSHQLDPRHCAPGLSQAWDAWCGITERSLPYFRQRLAAFEEVQDRIGLRSPKP